MSIVQGVDSSVSSFPPSVSEQLAEQTPNYIPKTAQGGAVIVDYQPKCDEVEVPYVPILARSENMGIVCQVVNGIVTPSLQILLCSVLGAIDASIPNKDQNRAVKHILRKQFDDAYLNICRLSYPDMNMGASGGEYYLEPNAKAFSQGTIRG